MKYLGRVAAVVLWLIPTLTLLALDAPAIAQGCGPINPNCIVPTRPPGTNDNTAASTAFVHTAVGTGFVSSVAAGCGATTFGPPITSTGTIAAVESTNPQTGTTYTIANGDCGFLTTFNNAAAIAVSLAQAGAGGLFPVGWFNDVCDLGAGTATITPTTSTIGGAATLVLPTGRCSRIVSDGANYQVVTYGGGGGTPGGSNTQLQYNNSSVFGGISGATSNGTTVTFGANDLILGGVTGSTQCLQANSSGVVTGVGTTCGGGGIALIAAGAYGAM